MFGWVVMLMTGQRFYLEIEMVGTENDKRPTDLEITLIPEHQRYPDELEEAAWYIWG
jgi:hypothetical protein